MENPDSNSTEIKRKDITAINYCVLTIAHTQHHNDVGDSFDSTRGSQTTTYEKIDATRILLALTDEMKEYGMDDDENPWLDIRSKTKIEAQELADALNFLIPRTPVAVKSEVAEVITPKTDNFWDEVQP